MSAKKKILLLATGGTIASKKSENGLKPQITPEELLEYIPQVKEFCEVSAIQLLNLDSSNMEPEHWKKIVHAIREYYDAYDGFVIAHGTDTMAYTAAALSYMIQNSTKPIVITGAQKPIDLEITDAKSNLIDIVESFGVGGIPKSIADEFYRLCRQYPDKLVVMATQVAHEGSDMTVYEVGHDMKKYCRFLESYDMTLESVIAKTMWMLGNFDLHSIDVEDIFYRSINYDVIFGKNRKS